ncbi:MAG: hypothetical protein IT393_09305 [Nitrospirae bacterium]|nr:hypothetical protein [Nitrospirota bacterium]
MSKVISRSTISFFIFFLQCIFLTSAFAWKVPIEISTTGGDNTRLYNKLIVGIEQGATDDFDNLWDTPALISLSDPANDSENPVLLRAYIRGRDGAADAAKYLWKDIRGTSTNGDSSWEITVDSVPAGKKVDLSWNVLPGQLKPGEVLLLKDVHRAGAGQEMALADITRDSGYSYISAGKDPRLFQLVLSKESSVNSGSGSGSGLGCGTIMTQGSRPTTSGGAVAGLLSLFSPLVVFRLYRLKRSGLW